MSGVVEKIVKPTAEVLEHISQKIPRALAHAHDRIGTMAHRAADHFDKVEEDIAGRVPVYVVDHEGNVKKIMDDGTLGDVPHDDGSGIRNILDGSGTTTPKRRGEYNLPAGVKKPDRPRVRSTKIDPGGGDLAQATQAARRTRGDKGSGNYAAFHYQGDDGNFILVGRSKPRTTTHSEQVVGVPFLANSHRLTGRVTDAYTEREPCQINAPVCSAWLAHHFPTTRVTHSFDYGPTKADEERGNQEHAAYIAGLGL